MAARCRPITNVMGVSHVGGIVAQEVLRTRSVGLIRIHGSRLIDDNSLAIYQLAATISSVASITIWERSR